MLAGPLIRSYESRFLISKLCLSRWEVRWGVEARPRIVSACDRRATYIASGIYPRWGCESSSDMTQIVSGSRKVFCVGPRIRGSSKGLRRRSIECRFNVKSMSVFASIAIVFGSRISGKSRSTFLITEYNFPIADSKIPIEALSRSARVPSHPVCPDLGQKFSK